MRQYPLLDCSKLTFLSSRSKATAKRAVTQPNSSNNPLGSTSKLSGPADSSNGFPGSPASATVPRLEDPSAIEYLDDSSDLSSLSHSDLEQPKASNVGVLAGKARPPKTSAKHTTGVKRRPTVSVVIPTNPARSKTKLAKHAAGSQAKKKAEGDRKTAEKEVKSAVKAKPKPKPEVVVEPPVFEKVDTRLGRLEAEQRIMVSLHPLRRCFSDVLKLREFLFRFRATLAVTERLLPPLDDFDRPLTEASVRLFAGSILEVIKHELEDRGADQEVRKPYSTRKSAHHLRSSTWFSSIVRNCATTQISPGSQLSTTTFLYRSHSNCPPRLLIYLGGSDLMRPLCALCLILKMGKTPLIGSSKKQDHRVAAVHHACLALAR